MKQGIEFSLWNNVCVVRGVPDLAVTESGKGQVCVGEGGGWEMWLKQKFLVVQDLLKLSKSYVHEVVDISHITTASRTFENVKEICQGIQYCPRNNLLEW